MAIAGISADLGKFVAVLRTEGLWLSLMKTRRNLLYRLHDRLIDARFDQAMGVNTRRSLDLVDERISSPNREHAVDYQPTPGWVINRVLQLLSRDLDDTSYIDFGAGRGRTLLYAARLPFKQVIGVEFAPSLHASTIHNLSRFPTHERKCGSIRCTLLDAVYLEIPDGPCVFYFFHPFEKHVLDKVIENIKKSYQASPRPLTIIYINPPKAMFLDDVLFLKRRSLSLTDLLRFSLLSPYPVRIYDTSGSDK